MAGKANPVANKGKAVLSVVLTVLVGLGGGIFAMRPDTVPSEPGSDETKAPVNAAESSHSSDTIALTVPNFSTEGTSAELIAPVAADRQLAASTAAGLNFAPHSVTSLAAASPGAHGARDTVEAASELLPVPLAAELPVQMPLREQPAAVAPAPRPAIAVIAVPEVQPANSPAGDSPETSSVSLPAAVLAENASEAAEPAPVSPAEAAPAAAPEAVPLPQLAIADWNYSLPDPSAPSGANAFAEAAHNAPITLVPSRATPVREAQRETTQSRAARTANGTRLATPTGKVATAVGNRKIAGSGFASATHGKGKYQFVGSDIEFQLPVVANGSPVGDLTLHVAPNQQVSLRLRELLSLFHDQIDPQQLTELVASPSINSFVTFDKLRDAGIDIRYDAGMDRISLSVEQP